METKIRFRGGQVIAPVLSAAGVTRSGCAVCDTKFRLETGRPKLFSLR